MDRLLKAMRDARPEPDRPTPGTVDVATLVRAARAGDRRAFDRLVRRHAAAAQAAARAWLGDEAAAADATQEAFFDAWRLLPQLSEPAAFPGWLRRIVRARCHRRLRVRAPLALGAVAEPGGILEATAEEALGAQQRRHLLLQSLGALPEPQRLCVALHHLAQVPVAEVARFLEVPVTTVKKRLVDARRRLAAQPGLADLNLNASAVKEAPMSAQSAKAVEGAGAAGAGVADTVALFLALQAGDRATVAALLQAEPARVEAEDHWSDAEALAGGFNRSHHLTPLILAAGQGDLPMVELLLAHGARPEGRCGCPNGESALWAAARAGHGAVVDRLAQALGAPAAAALVAAPAGGAAPWLPPGEVPGGGLRPAQLLAWRRHPPAVPWTPEALAWAPGAPLRTGIAALDLWLPLQVGDVVRVHGAAETGLMVLLAEVAHALAVQGIDTLWVGWATRPWQRAELATVARRCGLDPVAVGEAPRAEPEGAEPGRGRLHLQVGLGAAEDTLAEARRFVAAARAAGRAVCQVVFEQGALTAAVEAALPGLGDGAALTLVVQPWVEVTRGERAPPGHAPGLWQGTLVTDGRLASQGLFPALDFERTRRARAARPPGEAAAGPHGADEAETARALLAAYAAAHPDLRGGAPEDAVAARARRLLALLSQPFHAATPDTGWAGTRVAPAQLAADLAALRAGAFDATPEAALRYRRG